MKSLPTKSLMAASSLAALLALGACGERVVTDAPVSRAPDAAVAPAGPVANEGNTAVMGAAARVDDAQITAKVNAGLAADKDLSAIKIDVDTKDGVVTLMGPVPNNDAKSRATDIAKNVQDVKSVNNQLSVSAS